MKELHENESVWSFWWSVVGFEVSLFARFLQFCNVGEAGHCLMQELIVTVHDLYCLVP